MAEEIRQYIQNCERCLRYKQQPEWAELKPLEASYPLELVHMDYLKIGSKDDLKGYIHQCIANTQKVLEVHVC